MVFSNEKLELYIGGKVWGNEIGGLRFTHRISGFGTSGVVTGQFEFDIYDPGNFFSTAILEDWEVYLFIGHYAEGMPIGQFSRKYYISKRSISNNICHFTAYDVMKYIEEEFDPTSLGIFFDRGEKAPCGNVMSGISSQCKIRQAAFSAEGSELIQFTKEQVTGKTCREILEMVSEAMCGVWIADNDGGIVLSCFGSPYEGRAYVSDHAPIDYQGCQEVTRLICTNSDTGKVTDSGGSYGTVIAINSPFVANGSGLDGIVRSRVVGQRYQAWSCEKAVSLNYGAFFPPASCGIVFQEDGREVSLLANNVTIVPDSTGVYISVGSDPQDEEQWRYDDYNRRQLKRRLEFDKTAGNVQINTEKGIQFINKNASSARAAESNEPEKYGFNVDTGGVTEYDGAIVSNKVFETAEKIDDNIIIISYADDIKYKYTAEKDSKGNILSLKKERVENG